MHGATVSDPKQICPRLLIKVACQVNDLRDAVDLSSLLRTLRAIGGMDPIVFKFHANRFQVLALSSRVHAERHGGTSAKAGKQQIIGVWAGIFTDTNRFIRDEAVVAHPYQLTKISLPGRDNDPPRRQ